MIGHIFTLSSGLRLRKNADGTSTDQFGRLLEEFTNEKGQQDFRPIGVDPRGACH